MPWPARRRGEDLVERAGRALQLDDPWERAFLEERERILAEGEAAVAAQARPWQTAGIPGEEHLPKTYGGPSLGR